MTPLDVVEVYVFVLAAFVGYQVITRVPPLLHTPLMSATNAISGISLIGSLVVAGADYSPEKDGSLTVYNLLGFLAVSCSSVSRAEWFCGCPSMASP